MSPQFHVVHDNLFQTIMNVYKNDALTEHIWISLVQRKEDNTENLIEQADLEKATISIVHTDWLDSAGRVKSKSG